MSCKLSFERNEGLHHWEFKKQITCLFFVVTYTAECLCVWNDNERHFDAIFTFLFMSHSCSFVWLLCLLLMPLCSACGAHRVVNSGCVGSVCARKDWWTVSWPFGKSRRVRRIFITAACTHSTVLYILVHLSPNIQFLMILESSFQTAMLARNIFEISQNWLIFPFFLCFGH